MILSAGVGVVGLLLIVERAAAAARPLRQRLRHHPERLPGHAAHHEAAGLGPVLLLVRALRHVDLHHAGGDQPHLRHHRHHARRSTTKGPTGWGWASAPTTASRRSSPSASRCWRGGPAGKSGPRDLPGLRRPRACSRSSSSRTRGTCWRRMVGVGIAWASILAMPYAILTGSLPPSKMGYYMGVFNFFIVIPQIVAAALLGFLVGRFFGGEAIYALAIGGASLLLAAALTLRVRRPGRRRAGDMASRLPLLGLIGLGRGAVGTACRRAGAGRASVPVTPRDASAPASCTGTAPRSTSCSPTASATAIPPTIARWAARGTAPCCEASRAAISPACSRRSRRGTSTAWV